MNRVSDPQSSKHRKGCLWWAVRGLSVFLLLSIVMATYQTVTSRRDRRISPPPGDLITVDGLEMHLYCVGTGSPTVILEAGMTSHWLTWDLVQSGIGSFTRVCAYDRLGLGWSAPTNNFSQTSEVAERLQQLLQTASVAPPYVLVGHSLGGVHVRSFANQYREDVVGMVLVDSSHEEQNLRMPEELVALQTMPNLIWNACRVLAPFGLQRLLGMAEAEVELTPLSAESRQQFIAVANQTHFCRAAQQEETAGQLDLTQSAPPKSLGDLPLIVLSADIDLWEDEQDDLPAGITVELLEQDYAVWIELHQELAALSTRGRHQIIPDTTHFIQYDAPDIVIEAVREAVELARQ